MKKTKRLLSLLMAVSVCLSLLLSYMPPLRSQAATCSGQCGDNLTWELDSDGTLQITGSGRMYDYALEFADDLDGFWYEHSSAPWAEYSVVKVVVQDGVTSIGDYAFHDNAQLTDVTLPDSVISIGDYAFWMCESLTSVTFPVNLTDIGEYAFYWCLRITGVTIPGSVTSIGKCAFGYSGLTSVTLLDGVTGIGWNAFYSCPLTSVTIPGSVTSIGGDAFGYCRKLKSVTLHDGIAEIGNYAFRYCNSLSDLTIPASVNYIGFETFDGCLGLRNVYFGGAVPELGTYPFENCSNFTAYYHTGADGWENVTADTLTGGDSQVTFVESEHIWSGYTYDNNHTCTADGTKTGRCIFCGATETLTVENTALGHSFTDYVSNNDATCTQDGTRTAKCDRCDETDTLTDENTALGHSFTNYVSNNDATCTQDGTRTAKCDRCDETDTQPDTGTMAHRYTDGACIYCGESVPIASICGSVTAFGEGAVLLELVSQSGDVIDLSLTDSTYRLEGLAPGDYTLTVSQTDSVTRTYSLTLVEGENALDLKLQLPGDISGDGRYNMADIARLYAHVKGTKLLTGYELRCADFNGDERVNVGDVSNVYVLVRYQLPS